MAREYWTRFGSNKSPAFHDETCGHEHRTAAGAARCSGVNMSHASDTVAQYRAHQTSHTMTGKLGRVQTLLDTNGAEGLFTDRRRAG
jgi:hypothetical protein